MNTTLRLHSAGLLSKWGFNDGDAPYDLLDWCDATGTDYPSSWHVTLVGLVKDFLLPVLDQDVEVEIIPTSHNPIRASTVDGADVTRFHYLSSDPAEPVLTPESVEVPYEEVLRRSQLSG